MELQKHWPGILEVLGNASKPNRFFSIATVDADGNLSGHVRRALAVRVRWSRPARFSGVF